ncbi:hypothetical protein DN068_11935 [Taibaiella soli]|uniref:Uncharacterized protein n=1 Tax=Taibaiella soli TaxID=1649169 RepID=A0A2W2AF06_9BACT|nr:hypothetical protein DN068_21880 [Taibaiella soli]PZF72568.1 hypothetical protein DN068_11935 [Taibaiella soli]
MQSVVDLEFQMQGLSKSMFKRLLLNIEDRYDILFAMVSKLNPKFKAHLSVGWKTLRETDELFLLSYSIVH